MSDYGFRVSADGVDVKTGADKDMVVTSKYSMLKGSLSLSGTGTISVPRDAADHMVTIAHNLGYIPIVQAMFSDVNLDYWNTSNYILFPLSDFDGSTIFNVKVKADSTNVYLIFSIEDF